MDGMYLFYFLLGTLIFFGAKYAGRGQWNEDYTSRERTQMLRGIAALGVALHHMAQKTCGSWHPAMYRVHGLDAFLSVGYLLVGVFFFCSGLGLYRSLRSKPDYLKGFIRRRILPLVIAFYLSEIIYTLVRLGMGEKMGFVTVLWYLSGLHMANFNAWYLIVIPFFYLAFWAAFRFCKRDGAAILWVILFTLGYTVLGAFIDHQNDWWMRGEWWYNSVMLFPAGLLFGKYEQRLTARFKRGYPVRLLLSAAAAAALFLLSEWLNGHGWGYYTVWNDPMKVPHRLMSAAMQWAAALALVVFLLLLTMKVRVGNRALGWFGAASLEFYLTHGIFVELFGFNFLDTAKSLVWIKSVPLYIAAVLLCSVAASLVFGWMWRALAGLAGKKDSLNKSRPGALKRTRFWRNAEEGSRHPARYFILGAGLLLAAGCLILPELFGNGENTRVMNGLVFQIPEDYTREYTDSRYAVWKYTGNDKKPGNLILDADIRDANAQAFDSAERVLEICDFLTDTDIYVNPQGIRMARGFTDYSGSPERRYYIESGGSVVLMCMHEDEKYYDKDDCEAILLAVADGIRPVK